MSRFFETLIFAAAIPAIPAAFGQTLSLGAVGGASLTSDFGGTGTTIRSRPPASGTLTFITNSSRHALIVGPKVEFAFPGPVSVEVDALRRRRRSGYTAVFTPPVDLGFGLIGSESGQSAELFWEVPLLVKYRLPFFRENSSAGPFIEAGPSLRPWSYQSGIARAGITGGAGLQLRLGSVRLGLRPPEEVL